MTYLNIYKQVKKYNTEITCDMETAWGRCGKKIEKGDVYYKNAIKESTASVRNFCFSCGHSKSKFSFVKIHG